MAGPRPVMTIKYLFLLHPHPRIGRIGCLAGSTLSGDVFQNKCIVFYGPFIDFLERRAFRKSNLTSLNRREPGTLGAPFDRP